MTAKPWTTTEEAYLRKWAGIADNANLRGVEHRSLISEVKRIDAALAELK